MAVKPVCFNCGEPARTEVANTTPPQHRKKICMAEACWDRWYQEFGKRRG